MHACRNCVHYDASRAWNWCKSLSSEPPREPDIKNLCEEFELSEVAAQTDDQQRRKTKEAFDNLFKKKQ